MSQFWIPIQWLTCTTQMEDYSSICNDSVYAPYAHNRNDKRRISSSDSIFFSLGYGSYLFRETFPGERGCCGGCWNTTCMLHKRVRGTTQPHPPNTVLSPFRHNCARPGGIILRLMGGAESCTRALSASSSSNIGVSVGY